MVKRCVVLVAGILLMLAGNARAQESTAGDALLNILFGSEGEGALDNDVIFSLLDNLAAQTTSFPIGSSAGGFTWVFDPKLGVQTRKSDSFGPMFAERALTNGRGKLNIAFAYQHTKFDSLAGQPLDALKSSGPVDLEDAQGRVTDTGRYTFNTSLNVSIDRATVSASYGVTDRVDVGIVVPFGRTVVSGNSSALLVDSLGRERGRIDPVNQNGSSSGIGDVIFRGKAAIPTPPSIQLAAGIDFRLPTGDTDKLLGLGAKETKLMVMGGATRGKIAPHFNVGYTWAGNDEDSPFYVFNEVNYIFGIDVAATPTVTVMGDVIGRTLREAETLDFVNESGFSYFTTDTGNVNLLLGTIGTKIKVSGTWLFTASVLFPLNNTGIKPGITPVVGFERAF